MFVDMVNNPNIHCRWARKQWLVPDFGGIEVARGTQERQGWETSRRANIMGSSQLSALQAEGQNMVNRVVEQQSSASNQILMPLPSDMPSCSGTSADQPPLPVMPDLVNSTINQEVGVGWGIWIGAQGPGYLVRFKF